AAPADGPRWLLLHIPPWVSHKCPAAPCTERLDDRPLAAIRRLLRDPPSRIDLMLAGDTHMFQVFVPDTAAAPPQIVAGMSGDLLEPRERYGDVMDRVLEANLFDVAGRLWMHHGFGFMLLTRDEAGWTGILHDAAGEPRLRCDLKRAALDQARTD